MICARREFFVHRHKREMLESFRCRNLWPALPEGCPCRGLLSTSPSLGPVCKLSWLNLTNNCRKLEKSLIFVQRGWRLLISTLEGKGHIDIYSSRNRYIHALSTASETPWHLERLHFWTCGTWCKRIMWRKHTT